MPAVEALRIGLARKLLRRRRRIKLSQTELARRAGVRPGTLRRIEQGKVTPSIKTIDKIDRALKKAERG